MRGFDCNEDDTQSTPFSSLIELQYMQEGNPYYNLYNNDGAAAAAAYSYASAGGGTSGSSCAKDYKDYKDYSYYGSYFNQVSRLRIDSIKRLREIEWCCEIDFTNDALCEPTLCHVPLFKMAQFYGAAAGVGAASSASGYPMAAAAAAYGAVAANHHQSGHQQHNSHHQVRGLRISLDALNCWSNLSP